MVRIIKQEPNFDGTANIEGYCLSGDTKPVDGISTGSTMTEVDTGKVFFFDETANSGSEWVEQFSVQA